MIENGGNQPVSVPAEPVDMEVGTLEAGLPMEGQALPRRTVAERAHLRALAARLRQEAWTFDAVQERLVEAMLMLWRLPDRERGWLRVGTMRLWQLAGPTTGMNAEEKALYLRIDHDEPPRLPGLTRDEVDEMDEALDWVRWVPERDRKLVGLAIGMLAKGGREVAWRDLLAPMGLRLGADGLRMRYSRAIGAITAALNGGNPLGNESTPES